jgi:phage gpG-like protein
MNEEVGKIIKRILRDIQVELGDEFDRNFERQAFFSEAWARRKSSNRPGGTLLIDTGNLRRSVRSRTTENSITFFTDLPYAAIHNDGGEIVVTAKMKRYFRAKFYESQGGFERKKGIAKRTLSDGGFYAWTSKMNLTPVAEFWRFMALKRAGTTIRIPRRRFLGAGPEVERIVREIIEENLDEYFNVDFSIERK